MRQEGGPASLSGREKDVLSLLARGHDAKSAAGALGLSVHTVNDHLREARRKLAVTSSRAAARVLLEAEEAPPEKSGSEQFGMAAATVGMPDGDDPVRPGVAPFAYVLAGALIMLFIVLVAAITVQSTPAADPSVVATTPLAGSVIAPGPFILSVTFDQPMRDRSYSFVQTSRETYPDCPGRPEMSRDGRTFTLRCHAQAGRRYELWFNRQPYMNFRSHAGIRARPYRLLFAAGAR